MEKRSQYALGITSTGVVSAASGFDALVHTLPQYRYMLGPVIGNHIGNTLYTAAPIIAATLIGKRMEEIGVEKNNMILEMSGKALPILAMATMAIANFVAESFIGNYQFLGDMAFGLATIPVAYIAAKTAFDLFRNASHQSSQEQLQLA